MSSKDPQQLARKCALFRLIDSFEHKNIELALQLVKSDRSLYQAAKQRYYPILRELDPHLGQGLELLHRVADDIQRNENGWHPAYTAHYANLGDWEMVQWAIDRFPHSVRTVASVKLLSYMLSRELPGAAFVRDVFVSNDTTPLVIPDPAPGAIRLRSMSQLEVATAQQLEALLPLLPPRSDLHTVRANGCQLSALPEALVRPMNLSHLELNQNQFDELPELLRLARRLETLALRDNRLKQLPDWLWELPELRDIDLTGNPLESLPVGFLARSKVQHLNLQGNRIQDFGLREGDGNQDLKTLNLSFNPLKAFPLELMQLRGIKTLSMRSCGLTSLPPELAAFNGLDKLDLTGNPLSESPSK
ncbi:MAG TPA: leucine-rich repeat domain-containing protein, partial [Bacteroidia bacterium]|nr:leucine-rich repeat domain-containing protein [Bacteroidia bacterium]